jgi:hypothetical protein
MSRITAPHWRELQGVIAFQILEYYYELGDSQKKKTLYADGLTKIYHGNAQSETVSYASLAFTGEKPFSRLYKKVDPGTGIELHIPSSLTRDPSKNVVAGKLFTVELLKKSTLSSSRPVQGSTLWTHSETNLWNCKKASAFAKERLNPDGSLKSGTNNLDELWEHVLEKMWESSKTESKVGVDGDNEEENGESVPNGDRPQTWYFRGFWTFQLFGPMAPLDEQCALFNVDSLDALTIGRKQIRADKAKKKKGGAGGPLIALDTNNSMSPSGFKRGIGIKEKTAIVHLAQQQVMASKRDDELEFETMSKSIDVIKDELNCALAIVKQLGITDKEDSVWQNVFDLQKKFAEINREFTEYQLNKRQKREQDKKSGS